MCLRLPILHRDSDLEKMLPEPFSIRDGVFNSTESDCASIATSAVPEQKSRARSPESDLQCPASRLGLFAKTPRKETASEHRAGAALPQTSSEIVSISRFCRLAIHPGGCAYGIKKIPEKNPQLLSVTERTENPASDRPVNHRKTSDKLADTIRESMGRMA